MWRGIIVDRLEDLFLKKMYLKKDEENESVILKRKRKTEWC